MKYSNSPEDIEHLREVLGSALENVGNVSVVLRDGKVFHGTIKKTHSDHTNEAADGLWKYGGEIILETEDESMVTLDCQDIERVGAGNRV